MNCGHPAPYLLHDGALIRLDTGEATLPLGMRALAPGAGGPHTYDFPLGTTLLCLTDGVTEARNARGVFYDPCRDLRPATDGDPERLIDALFASVGHWTSGERDDDMAVVAVARHGADRRDGEVGRNGEVGRDAEPPGGEGGRGSGPAGTG